MCWMSSLSYPDLEDYKNVCLKIWWTDHIALYFAQINQWALRKKLRPKRLHPWNRSEPFHGPQLSSTSATILALLLKHIMIINQIWLHPPKQHYCLQHFPLNGTFMQESRAAMILPFYKYRATNQIEISPRPEWATFLHTGSQLHENRILIETETDSSVP